MIHVILLAIIQALTEFIPVSSSGHLLIAEKLTPLNSSLVIDVSLHIGTLLALVYYFKDKLVSLATKPLETYNKPTIINLVISSIPAALTGYLFADFLEGDARNILLTSLMLFLAGLLMVLSDRIFKPKKEFSKLRSNDITKKNALLIGLGQSLALIPGTSRSGATMLTSRALGYSNKLSAEYSFLIGIPVILGASIKVFASNFEYVQDEISQIIVGATVAFLVGLAVLRFLIKFISRRGLTLFGWYRLALSLILFIIWLSN